MNFGTGQAGEKHIAKLLKRRGFCILEMNFHSRFGEIDIIAENRQYIVFVEVKTRERNGLVKPFEAITPAKQSAIPSASASERSRSTSPLYEQKRHRILQSCVTRQTMTLNYDFSL